MSSKEVLFDRSKVVEMTFEDAMKALELVVSRLEGGDLGLEDAIKAYEDGTILKQHCEEKLRQAKLRVDTLTLSHGGSSSGDSGSSVG